MIFEDAGSLLFPGVAVLAEHVFSCVARVSSALRNVKSEGFYFKCSLCSSIGGLST